MAESDVRIDEKTGLKIWANKSKDAPVLRWYVLKAISGKEASVKEYIELDRTGCLRFSSLKRTSSRWALTISASLPRGIFFLAMFS